MKVLLDRDKPQLHLCFVVELRDLLYIIHFLLLLLLRIVLKSIKNNVEMASFFR